MLVVRLSVLAILCCSVTADCGCTPDEVLFVTSVLRLPCDLLPHFSFTLHRRAAKMILATHAAFYNQLSVHHPTLQ